MKSASPSFYCRSWVFDGCGAAFNVPPRFWNQGKAGGEQGNEQIRPSLHAHHHAEKSLTTPAASKTVAQPGGKEYFKIVTRDAASSLSAEGVEMRAKVADAYNKPF